MFPIQRKKKGERSKFYPFTTGDLCKKITPPILVILRGMLVTLGRKDLAAAQSARGALIVASNDCECANINRVCAKHIETLGETTPGSDRRVRYRRI